MKKRNVLKTIMIVMLLCTTSICIIAVNNKASASDSPGTEDGIYVDPNIRLTKIVLPKFKQVLGEITDPQYKEIIQRITKIIETKRYANSNDIKNILIELGMTTTDVYRGWISGGDYVWGSAAAPKFFPLGSIWWIGRETYLAWGAEGNPDFMIAGNHITYKHHAQVFPNFFGMWSTGITSLDPFRSQCCINGWGSLIFVTPI